MNLYNSLATGLCKTTINTTALQSNIIRYMATIPSLDRTDFAILELLLNNGRLSNKEIAAAVRLAPSTCHERLKRLQKIGVLRGTHAEINLQSVGLNLEALLLIELAKHERSVVDQFMDETESIPEVLRAFLVTGRYDLVVHVAVRDIEHLRNLAFDRFTSQPAVVRIETSIVFDSRGRHRSLVPWLSNTGENASNPTSENSKERKN